MQTPVCSAEVFALLNWVTPRNRQICREVSYPGTTEDNEHRAKAVGCESDTFLLLHIAATGGKEA
jgi:hypothetical protein